MTAALALHEDLAAELTAASVADKGARDVLADYWLERGRWDIALQVLDRLPRELPDAKPRKLRKRVDKMTKAETEQMAGWAKKWIDIGLSTQPADRPLFDAAVRACYRHSGLAEPKAVVWCPSPIVVALAGPIAHAALIELARERSPRAVGSAVGSAVHSAVHSAVGSAVGSAVHSAVDSAVDSAVHSAVDSAVHSAVGSAVGSAVHSAVDSAVGSAVDSAVDSAVGSAVDSAVHSAVDSAVGSAVKKLDAKVFNQQDAEWFRYLGGQFWVGWYYWWGPAAASFAIDVLRLDIGRELELRQRAYAACATSACWFWPHSEFVLVSERPHTLTKHANGKLERVAWDGWEVAP